MSELPLCPEFATYKASPEGQERIITARNIFNEALNQLLLVCPAGRELSLVRTKLEEASFFAIKAIAKCSSDVQTAQAANIA